MTKKKGRKTSKIPGAKHRGVKYPLQQARERLAKIADKINCPISGDQEVPKSFLRMTMLQKLSNQNKTQLINGRQKPEYNSIVEQAKTILPNILLTEEEVEKSAKQLGTELQALSSSGKWDIKMGEKQSSSSRKNDLKHAIDEYEEDFRAKIEGVPHDKNIVKTKMSKSLMLKARRLAKAKVKSEETKYRDFNDYKDHVKFGEVVKAPPCITIHPKMKGKMNNLQNKVGGRNLLLNTKKQNSKLLL